MKLAIWEKALISVLCAMGIMVAYLILVMLPVAMFAERECLAAGYPRAHVTFMLERYCITMDGAVTLRVDRK
jgi:hypothetical protein